MKISAVVFSSLLASAAADHHHRALERVHRKLQFGLEGWFGGGDTTDTSTPLDNLLDDLASGWEDLINMASIQAMDPLVIPAWSAVFNDTMGLTSCTAPINVTFQAFSLTGLSSVSMDRFELVPNTEQESTEENWWSSILTWTGNFEMLMTASDIVLEGGFSIVSDDLACLGEGAPEGGVFSTGMTVNLTNPTVEMLLQIGGSTTEGIFGAFFGDTETLAESIQTNNVSFVYDTWTIEFDNPMIAQTIHVADLIQTVDSFLTNTMNISDFAVNWEDLGFEGFDTSQFTAQFGQFGDQMGSFGIDAFLQDQVNAVMKSASFKV